MMAKLKLWTFHCFIGAVLIYTLVVVLSGTGKEMG